MKGFLIIGAYGQKGFEYCSRFLEDGFKVYHYNFYDDTLEANIIEEKRLQIGRNSNFSEVDLDDLFLMDELETLSIIVPETVESENKEEYEDSEDILVILEEFLKKLDHIKEIFLFLPGIIYQKKEKIEQINRAETANSIDILNIEQYHDADELVKLVTTNKQEIL